jgi:hypothetical protein
MSPFLTQRLKFARFDAVEIFLMSAGVLVVALLAFVI